MRAAATRVRWIVKLETPMEKSTELYFYSVILCYNVSSFSSDLSL